MTDSIKIVIGDPPLGVTTEWFGLDSHLGIPKGYAFGHPVKLSVPIPEGAQEAWITIRHDTLPTIQLDSTVQVGNELVLTFGWYGPEWSLGVSFGF